MIALYSYTHAEFTVLDYVFFFASLIFVLVIVIGGVFVSAKEKWKREQEKDRAKKG